MNYDSYLARAIEIFNDKMDADFSRDNVILTCFMTDDQEEIFEPAKRPVSGGRLL